MIEHDFSVFCNIKYPDTKLNSPRDILNCMCESYQFSSLSHFGKVVVILSIISATFCSAEQLFSVLKKLKSYLRSTRDQDCLSHLALLRIERSGSNRIDTEKVIDKFQLRKGLSFSNKFLFI